MKLVIIAVALSIASVIADKYTDKYDSMNVDEVINNKRLYTAYCKCILDEGKCTSEAKELKSHISEALQNGCANCTDAQRIALKKVIKHMINKDNDSWSKMIEKYDPKRVYTNKYEKELKSLH